MKIYLLTHQREAERPTNTGQLAIDLFPQQVSRITWSRVCPNQELQRLAATKKVALIHPSGRPIETSKSDRPQESSYHEFILLDATWQEAQKILNRTPYLKQLDTFSLNPELPSRYRLRRNQKVKGLCTAECIIELFKTQNEIKSATLLLDRFERFNSLN